VPRSEIDEINSTIYELKNKVRNLEQQLNENQKGEDLQ
jgi:cell division protein FtsL